MAAKSLREALNKVPIKEEIQKAFCVGSIYELIDRIDLVEEKILLQLERELRDYFAHQTQYFEGKGTLELFEHVFKDIKAYPDEH